mmetsp:Transcript_26538/g.30570  ORF Transcript_26538/g.30570 Transcript_26538/m.30570 type:complete len:543 (+) Transcript_26538:115-1743(+)
MVEKGPCALATNVSKPENHGLGRQQITDYLITTSFDGGKGEKLSESLVRRTFEDFKWIQKRLVEERMGIIVPVLKSKKPTKNKDLFSESFVQMRQESLERFLQRSIHHPELVSAPCLYSFFTSNPTEWKKAMKEGVQSDKDSLLLKNTTDDPDDELAHLDSIQIDAHAAMYSPEEKKKGPMRRWFANKREQWALQNENLFLEETPVESKKFADIQTYADHLEVCARILSKDFKEIMSSQQMIAEKTATMGAAYAQMWGEHELSNTSSSNLYQTLGKVWANASKTIQNHVSVEERYFDCPVEDLVMDIVALQAALSNRKAAVYTYTKFTQQCRDLNKKIDKMKASNNMAAQQDRYHKLEQDLRHCDSKIEANRNHCELVTSRLGRDIERFRVDWHERLRCVLEIFHKHHVDFLQSQANGFSSLLPSLATLDSTRSNLPTEPKIEKMEINMSFTSGGAKVSVDHVQNESPPVDNNVPLPDPSPAAAAPPPPISDVSSTLDNPLESIHLNGSFSSDDGFGAISTMGGEAHHNQTSTTNKPIMKSV